MALQDRLNGPYEHRDALMKNDDPLHPPPPEAPVESQVTFFLKVDKHDKAHENGGAEDLYLGPKFLFNKPPFKQGQKVATPTFSDELPAEMKKAEDGDARYLERLAKAYKKPMSTMLRWYTSTKVTGTQLTFTKKPEFFQAYMVSEPGESNMMRYGEPFQMSVGSLHWKEVNYPKFNPKEEANSTFDPVLATPSIPGVYDKFALILLNKEWADSWRGEEAYNGNPDPYRMPSNHFIIEFAGWPENMKDHPKEYPKKGQMVCTGDRVRLTIVREDAHFKPTDHNRGYALPIFSDSVGDIDWHPSVGTTFTFHYGPVTWQPVYNEANEKAALANSGKEIHIPR